MNNIPNSEFTDYGQTYDQCGTTSCTKVDNHTYTI